MEPSVRVDAEGLPGELLQFCRSVDGLEKGEEACEGTMVSAYMTEWSYMVAHQRCPLLLSSSSTMCRTSCILFRRFVPLQASIEAIKRQCTDDSLSKSIDAWVWCRCPCWEMLNGYCRA